MDNEKTFFHDDTVSVTSTRIITGGTTYPLSGITAVSCAEHKAGGKLIGILMMMVGLTSALMSFTSDLPLAGIIFAGLFIWGFMKFKKRSYFSIVISTAGQQNDIFTNYSREYIVAVVDAINNAIIDRG